MPLEDLLHPYLKHYLEMPGWLKASAGRAYACLPRRVRLGTAYDTFHEALSAPADAATTSRRAREKLEATLRWALDTVPAYRPFRKRLGSEGDALQLLASLPVTDKLDIKRNIEHYLSSAVPSSLRLPVFTGGSTRHPMQFYLHKHVTRPKEYAFMQDFRSRIGVGAHDLTLSLRGRSVPAAAQPHGQLWMHEPIRQQLILSSDHLEQRYMPRYAEVLARYRPGFIEAFPSALYPLARWLAAHPLPEFTDGVRGVMLFSENVYAFQMRMFRSVFGCPVLKHYGHSERVLMAASMPDDERYFFWPQYGWFELLDGDDRPITQPGILGHVVGTSFDNKVMPLVRYRTGDLAVLSAGGHPALPGYIACDSIEGRLQEFVVCRDRRLISVTTLGAAHFGELGLADAIQYEQREPGAIVLRIMAPRAPTPEAVRRIERAVKEKTQGGCDVSVMRVDRIDRTPRGKRRMLIQHLDISGYFGAATVEHGGA